MKWRAVQGLTYDPLPETGCTDLNSSIGAFKDLYSAERNDGESAALKRQLTVCRIWRSTEITMKEKTMHEVMIQSC